MSLDSIERIAAASGCDLVVGAGGWRVLDDHISKPTNPMRGDAHDRSEPWRRSLPVIGSASAGAGGCYVDGGGVTWFSVEEAVQRQLDGLVYVHGDSMAPMLEDGDMVGLRRVDALVDGDVAVIQDLRADVLHIKVWQAADDDQWIYLRSVNPAHQVLIFRRADVQVLGVAYGLMRLKKLRVR